MSETSGYLVSAPLCVGTSAGGVDALRRLLKVLPKTFAPAIVVVMHLPRVSTIDHELIFGGLSHLKPTEAQDKMPIQQSHIYFAPADYHLLVERDNTFALSQDEKVHHSRPSIDVFFDSVASAYRNRAIGMLLTGASADGATGMQNIQQEGGYTIVQNPANAEIATMPQAALEIMTPNFIGNIEMIAQHLTRFCRGTRDE